MQSERFCVFQKMTKIRRAGAKDHYNARLIQISLFTDMCQFICRDIQIDLSKF